MRDTNERLQRTKMILTGGIFVLVGIALVLIEEASSDTETWLRIVPFDELGGVLIGAGVLGIWIDYLFKRETEEANDTRLRKLLAEHAPAMRDSVIDAFAADRDDLARVATPELLDALTRNSLALRLDDAELADEIAADLHNQVVEADERWSNLDIDVTLTPHVKHADYFVVTTRWEYTVVPVNPTRRFICLSDRREYAELLETRSHVSPWFFKPDPNFNAGDRAAFEVITFAIDGKGVAVRRSQRKNYQRYTATVPKAVLDSGRPVQVSYSTRTVTRADGNLLFFDIEQPTKNVKVSLDYGDVPIAAVSPIDLVPSVRPTRIEHTPAEVPTRQVRVEIDGWTFPRSGVAFVWSLESSGDALTNELDAAKEHRGGSS